MREKFLLLLSRLWRKPGTRISAFGAAAMLVAFIAPFLDRTMPEELTERFSRDAVLPILNILASSMLAVTTFSLGNMVAAFRSAAGQATPRVYRILIQDMTTMNVLSVFVGAFLFSLTSIVMFRAGFYGPSAAVMVFGMTIVCIVLIIIAILRWIAHLSQLGSLDHTMAMVERTASAPLQRLANAPNLGARASANSPKIPDGATPLPSPQTGFVQFISFAEMNEQLEENNATLWVTTPPGRWVLKGTALGYASGECDPDSVIENYTIGDDRSIEQDARFGMVILSEVASRALSPGVNDPGTAIDVIHRLERILWDMGETIVNRDPDKTPEYDRIIIGTVSAKDLMQDGFAALMEDGGSRYDVMAKVIKSTGRLAQSEWDDLAAAAEKTRDTALSIIDRRIDDPEVVKKLHEKAGAS